MQLSALCFEASITSTAVIVSRHETVEDAIEFAESPFSTMRVKYLVDLSKSDHAVRLTLEGTLIRLP